MGCKQHSLVPINRQSEQAALMLRAAVKRLQRGLLLSVNFVEVAKFSSSSSLSLSLSLSFLVPRSSFYVPRSPFTNLRSPSTVSANCMAPSEASVALRIEILMLRT